MMTEPRFKYLVYDATKWYDGASECDSLEKAEKEFNEKTENRNIPWNGELGKYYYDYVAILKVIKIQTFDDGVITVCGEVR